MGDIATSVAREIDERRARLAGRPDLELLEHLLVAVQRERVAAVGYDTTRLVERLARSRLPASTRRAIARAVGRIWLDENMHARYVLGLLMRHPSLATQLGAMRKSAEGGAGGWMASVEQHTTWGEAPAERLAAALLEIGGRLTGQLPAAVRDSLGTGPLRAWCTFSLDAEQSAVMSFRRMRELAPEVRASCPESLSLPDGFELELERMERDEIAHGHVFDAIARRLGDDDDFVAGCDAAQLEAALAAVEGPIPAFTGRAAASGEGEEAPGTVGSGGVVVVARGESEQDKIATFDRALDASGLLDRVDRCARARGKQPADALVAVKIDLMLAWHRRDPSSYVDPELVSRLADRLWDRGYRDIAVCDAQNVYARFYANRTVEAVGRYVGLGGPRYRLVDLSLEQVPFELSRAMGVYEVGRTWRDADVRISFAKLKTHPTAVAQLALRNVGTVIPQMGEHFFTDRIADFTALMVGLLHDLPPHFALVDGYAYAADGLLGVLADPTPKHPRLVVAGADALCVDLAALALMGERDPSRAPDVRACFEWFGDPRSRAWIQGDLTPIADWDAADEGLLAAPLAALAGPFYASFSGRGALVTPDMDPDAFPPLGESAPLAAARRVLRVLLGMGGDP